MHTLARSARRAAPRRTRRDRRRLQNNVESFVTLACEYKIPAMLATADSWLVSNAGKVLPEFPPIDENATNYMAKKYADQRVEAICRAEHWLMLTQGYGEVLPRFKEAARRYVDALNAPVARVLLSKMLW